MRVCNNYLFYFLPVPPWFYCSYSFISFWVHGPKRDNQLFYCCFARSWYFIIFIFFIMGFCVTPRSSPRPLPRSSPSHTKPLHLHMNPPDLPCLRRPEPGTRHLFFIFILYISTFPGFPRSDAVFRPEPGAPGLFVIRGIYFISFNSLHSFHFFHF